MSGSADALVGLFNSSWQSKPVTKFGVTRFKRDFRNEVVTTFRTSWRSHDLG